MSDPKQIVLRRLICAREEAERFIGSVNRAIDSVDTPKKEYYRNREFAASKRSSLDLAKTLVDLRRSPYR